MLVFRWDIMLGITYYFDPNPTQKPETRKQSRKKRRKR